VAELNSPQKPEGNGLTSGLFGSDVFSFDLFENADETVKSSISDLVADCQPVMELEPFGQPANDTPAPPAPPVPPVPQSAPQNTAASPLSVTIPAERPVQVVLNRPEDSSTIGLETVASETVFPVAAKPTPITLPQAETPQPIPAPIPQPVLRTQPAPPISIIPELASLLTEADEIGYSRFAAPSFAPEPDFIPIVIPAPAVPPITAPAPTPAPPIAAPAPVFAQELPLVPQGQQVQQPHVPAPEPSSQLKLDLIPPRPVITEPAPEIAAIAVSQAPSTIPAPPVQQAEPPAINLPEPIAVLKPAPVPQPTPILEPAPVPQPAPVIQPISSPQPTPILEPAPLPQPVSAPQPVSKTPEPAPLPNALFQGAGAVEIDDAEIEPVEPASDWRWQGNKILLPLDRPLPKVEDQHARTTPVTPVQEIPTSAQTSVSEQLRETVKPAIPETTPRVTQAQERTLIPELASLTKETTAPLPQITETTPSAPTAQAATAAQTAPVAQTTAPAPQPVITPLYQPTSVVQPAATPAPAPAPQPVAVITPISAPAPTPAPAPVQAPASAPIAAPLTAATIASIGATVANHQIAEPLPITPDATRAPGGALVKDEALDIDDSEEAEYLDDEDEGKSLYSGPRFIVILIVILVLEMFFVGALVSLGVLDPSEIAAFWGNLFS
jgi:hypothetical protein